MIPIERCAFIEWTDTFHIDFFTRMKSKSHFMKSLFSFLNVLLVQNSFCAEVIRGWVHSMIYFSSFKITKWSRLFSRYIFITVSAENVTFFYSTIDKICLLTNWKMKLKSIEVYRTFTSYIFNCLIIYYILTLLLN